MRRLLLLLLALLPAPAAAQAYCEELWFTRNLLFDRAGHCFSTALGQAVFDNADCRGKVVLQGAEADTMRRLLGLERAAGCRVDTRRGWVEVAHIGLRRQMGDLPIPLRDSRGCTWSGEVLPLRLARDAGAVVSAAARPGDRLTFSFEDAGGWRYAELRREGRVIGAGWTEAGPVTAGCSADGG
jgi:hypothetical protein